MTFEQFLFRLACCLLLLACFFFFWSQTFSDPKVQKVGMKVGSMCGALAALTLICWVIKL